MSSEGVVKKGDNWFVENLKDRSDITVVVAANKEKVYVSKLSGCVVTVTGKVTAVAADGCTSTAIVINDDVVCSFEATNCKKLQVQTNGSIPVFQIEKTQGGTVFLSSESSRNASIVTSLSTEINVVVPGATEDDDPIEMAIPEQFASTYANGKLTTGPTSHV